MAYQIGSPFSEEVADQNHSWIVGLGSRTKEYGEETNHGGPSSSQSCQLAKT